MPNPNDIYPNTSPVSLTAQVSSLYALLDDQRSAQLLFFGQDTCTPSSTYYLVLRRSAPAIRMQPTRIINNTTEITALDSGMLRLSKPDSPHFS